MIGGGVFDGLNVVVNGDGNGASGAGEIAANHKDDAKFTDRVGKSEDNGSDYSGKRKRKNNSSERAPFVCTEDAGSGEKFWVETFERGDEGLDAKRKTVENAGNDEASESEGERVTEESEPEFAERTARAHGDEEIEAEDGRRKNERKSDDGFDQEFGAKFGEDEPVGERRGEAEKNHGDEKSEAKREKEFSHRFNRVSRVPRGQQKLVVWQSRSLPGFLFLRGWQQS